MKVRKRNPVARDLRTPKYRLRVVKSKKLYSRKAKHPEQIHEQSSR